ncbi:EAL domain-containing protein [Thiobacter aerophilum]|uniref:EAL domain-containing protein n=1 Tax=Thiobacter aerophilum TaxID=3121275 RepID=A0ABV0EHT1_9BURK
MVRFWQSLRGRILASVILVHAALSAYIAADFVHRERILLGEQFRGQAGALARNLATSSGASLVSRDLDTLDALTGALRQVPHLAFALVTDDQGRVRASSDDSLFDQVLGDEVSRRLLSVGGPQVLEHGGIVDAVYPVEVAGRTVGYARVAFSRASLDAAISRLIWRGVGFTVLAIVLGGLVAWGVTQAVTRRLARLSTAADAVASGDLEVRIEGDEQPDEVGQLARDFRVMVQALRTERARRDELEARLWEEKELAEVTLTSIGDAVITTDVAGQVSFMNPVAERLTGWRRDEARGKPLTQVFRILDETRRVPIVNPVETVLATGQVVGLGNHTLLISRDGRELNIEDSAAPIRDRDGDILGVVLVFHDVTEAHTLQAKLRWAASHDPLTGLYNRAEFEQRLQALLEVTRPGDKHALLYVDLDQFKVVNDTCGHVAGDELLRRLALEMQAQVRLHDVLARLGGDEFGLLLPYTSATRAREIGMALLTMLQNHRFLWKDRTFTTGASVGLVTIDGPGHGVSELLSAADTACYAAKEEGRGRIVEYVAESVDFKRRAQEMDWVARLAAALDQNRFRLFWQPIRAVTGEEPLRHGEVLLRLEEEDGSLTLPGAFLAAAERYQLMGRIDRWVIETAFQWLAQHPGNLCLSINLSGQSLTDDRLLEWVKTRLKHYGVPCARICFEITETAAIANLQRAVTFMEGLRRLGCRFSLDDFGAGLSSFAYLRNLPVDFVKIDGSFVRRIVADPVDRAMVEAVRDVARVMNIHTVAEYVESEAILAMLGELGVHYAQGWAVGRPVPLDAVE